MEVNRAAVTVRLAVPEIVPDMAVIVEVPTATPCASPVVLTVATGLADDFHVAEAVRSCVLPSLRVPVAVNCCERPAAIVAVAGETAIETRTGAVTVSTADPVFDPLAGRDGRSSRGLRRGPTGRRDGRNRWIGGVPDRGTGQILRTSIAVLPHGGELLGSAGRDRGICWGDLDAEERNTTLLGTAAARDQQYKKNDCKHRSQPCHKGSSVARRTTQSG